MEGRRRVGGGKQLSGLRKKESRRSGVESGCRKKENGWREQESGWREQERG